MDIQRYSKDEYKKMMSELVQYEDFVTEVSVTKQIRGGKLPARVYTIVLMEPDAINLKELEAMKRKGNVPQGAPPATKPKAGDTVVASEDVGVPRK